jgi:membrane fusion protein (multidrug efflux system)
VISTRLRRAAFRGACLGAASLALAACSGGDKKDKGPPEVGYAVAKPTDAPTETELQGRTSAFRTAEVRPQVSGVIEKRLFTEGSMVHAGQPLYRIDPSLYRASTQQAQANLAAAIATAEAAKVKADRYKPLAADQAVAQQDYTDALATARQTAAAVEQNRALLNTARINLRFTTVPAPVSGRIGRSLVTEGALTTVGQTDALAVISVLDPIYVDIQQSSTELLQLRAQLAQGDATVHTAEVKLKLEDGSTYPLPGSLEFTEVTVDPSTGTVALRARFPNPQGVLLPGMFVRAMISRAVEHNIYLVPESAITRDARGDSLIWLVGPGNKAVQRAINAERVIGTNWVVTGLKPGDKIITQGLGRVKPNLVIKPVPENTAQHPISPKKQ